VPQTHTFKSALIEAGFILLFGSFIGLLYSGLSAKGLFLPNRPDKQMSETVPGKFLSFDEALALHENRKALFVDARHHYDFSLGHIEGALNIPLYDFDSGVTQLSGLAKNTMIVTYCDGSECNSSVGLAAKLDSAGYTRVHIFFGGWNEWLSHHQPVKQ
jgi:rhodanese-related sulfurtransferase